MGKIQKSPSNNTPMSAQISISNSEMLGCILDFYVKDDSLVWDSTYGVGGFWEGLIRKINLIKTDIQPFDSTVEKMDYNLPSEKIKDVDCIIYDPPFFNGGEITLGLSNTGVYSNFVRNNIQSNKVKGENNIPENVFSSVLKNNGIVVFKTQRLYSNNDLFIFQIKDVMILVTPFRPVRYSSYTSRKNYTFWYILEKKV